MDRDQNKLRSLLHESHLIIKELQSLEDALETEARLARTREVYTTKPVSYHNILCSNCHYVCHPRCTLNEMPKRGDKNSLSTCSSFTDDGQCQHCPKRCTVEHHYRAKKLIKLIDRSEMETLKAAIKTKLQSQLTEIERCVKHLVTTHAECNIAIEFSLFVDYLESDIKQLKSDSVKHQANELLRAVITIWYTLSNQQPRQSNVQVKEEVEDHLATLASCHQMPPETNTTDTVTSMNSDSDYDNDDDHDEIAKILRQQSFDLECIGGEIQDSYSDKLDALKKEKEEGILLRRQQNIDWTN